MAQERVKGYVVGSDRTSKGIVWVVRVNKDSAHPLCGVKLNVISVREGVALGTGLNVDFIIGTQRRTDEDIPVAADVRITTPAEDPPQETPKASAKEKESDDVFTVYVVGSDGCRSLTVHPFWTVDQATEDINDASGGEERVVAARSFTDREIGGVMHVMRGLSLDSEVEHVETLLNAVFELGVEYQKKASQS